MQHWDDDNGRVYLPDKGEIINDNKLFYGLSACRNCDPRKGGGWVPKRA